MALTLITSGTFTVAYYSADTEPRESDIPGGETSDVVRVRPIGWSIFPSPWYEFAKSSAGYIRRDGPADWLLKDS